MTNAVELMAQADLAASSGDLARAQELLGKAAQLEANDLNLLLKLAAIERATGSPELALVTVHRALVVDPRDFTALLMRASLLDRLDRAEAAEAWAHAMAQKPAGELPVQLAQVIASKLFAKPVSAYVLRA